VSSDFFSDNLFSEPANEPDSSAALSYQEVDGKPDITSDIILARSLKTISRYQANSDLGASEIARLGNVTFKAVDLTQTQPLQLWNTSQNEHINVALSASGCWILQSVSADSAAFSGTTTPGQFELHLDGKRIHKRNRIFDELRTVGQQVADHIISCHLGEVVDVYRVLCISAKRWTTPPGRGNTVGQLFVTNPLSLTNMINSPGPLQVSGVYTVILNTPLSVENLTHTKGTAKRKIGKFLHR
jgi:hypothetical protein